MVLRKIRTGALTMWVSFFYENAGKKGYSPPFLQSFTFGIFQSIMYEEKKYKGAG